jgi:Protein of unknown function (DUF3224)
MRPLATLALEIVAALSVGAAASSKEPTLMHVSGTFDVKLAPQAADNPHARAAGITRLGLEKQFQGGLQGTSQGEMLACGDAASSGAYVALEKFTGSLHGRSGSFSLVHSAVMNRGVPQNWSVAVVPDSATGELGGLTGTLRIRLEAGKHFYDFEYTLP